MSIYDDIIARRLQEGAGAASAPRSAPAAAPAAPAAPAASIYDQIARAYDPRYALSQDAAAIEGQFTPEEIQGFRKLIKAQGGNIDRLPDSKVRRLMAEQELNPSGFADEGGPRKRSVGERIVGAIPHFQDPVSGKAHLLPGRDRELTEGAFVGGVVRGLLGTTAEGAAGVLSTGLDLAQAAGVDSVGGLSAEDIRAAGRDIQRGLPKAEGVTGTVGQITGSVIPSAASIIASGGSSAPVLAYYAVVGSGSGFQAYRDQVEQRIRSRAAVTGMSEADTKRAIDEETRLWQQITMGLGYGAVEVIAEKLGLDLIGGQVSRIVAGRIGSKILDGNVKAASGYLGRQLLIGTIEGTEEGLTTVAQNVLTKWLSDPSRGLTEGVGQSFAQGFVGGQIIGSAAVLGGAYRQRLEAREAELRTWAAARRQGRQTPEQDERRRRTYTQYSQAYDQVVDPETSPYRGVDPDEIIGRVVLEQERALKRQRGREKVAERASKARLKAEFRGQQLSERAQAAIAAAGVTGEEDVARFMGDAFRGFQAREGRLPTQREFTRELEERADRRRRDAAAQAVDWSTVPTPEQVTDGGAQIFATEQDAKAAAAAYNAVRNDDDPTAFVLGRVVAHGVDQIGEAADLVAEQMKQEQTNAGIEGGQTGEVVAGGDRGADAAAVEGDGDQAGRGRDGGPGADPRAQGRAGDGGRGEAGVSPAGARIGGGEQGAAPGGGDAAPGVQGRRPGAAGGSGAGDAIAEFTDWLDGRGEAPDAATEDREEEGVDREEGVEEGVEEEGPRQGAQGLRGGEGGTSETAAAFFEHMRPEAARADEIDAAIRRMRRQTPEIDDDAIANALYGVEKQARTIARDYAAALVDLTHQGEWEYLDQTIEEKGIAAGVEHMMADTQDLYIDAVEELGLWIAKGLPSEAWFKVDLDDLRAVARQILEGTWNAGEIRRLFTDAATERARTLKAADPGQSDRPQSWESELEAQVRRDLERLGWNEGSDGQPFDADELKAIKTGVQLRGADGFVLGSFPKIDTSSPRKVANTLKRVLARLRNDAIARAEEMGAQGKLALGSLQATSPDALSVADVETILMVLFDPEFPGGEAATSKPARAPAEKPAKKASIFEPSTTKADRIAQRLKPGEVTQLIRATDLAGVPGIDAAALQVGDMFEIAGITVRVERATPTMLGITMADSAASASDGGDGGARAREIVDSWPDGKPPAYMNRAFIDDQFGIEFTNKFFDDMNDDLFLPEQMVNEHAGEYFNSKEWKAFVTGFAIADSVQDAKMDLVGSMFEAAEKRFVIHEVSKAVIEAAIEAEHYSPKYVEELKPKLKKKGNAEELYIVAFEAMGDVAPQDFIELMVRLEARVGRDENATPDAKLTVFEAFHATFGTAPAIVEAARHGYDIGFVMQAEARAVENDASARADARSKEAADRRTKEQEEAEAAEAEASAAAERAQQWTAYNKTARNILGFLLTMKPGEAATVKEIAEAAGVEQAIVPSHMGALVRQGAAIWQMTAPNKYGPSDGTRAAYDALTKEIPDAAAEDGSGRPEGDPPGGDAVVSDTPGVAGGQPDQAGGDRGERDGGRGGDAGDSGRPAKGQRGDQRRRGKPGRDQGPGGEGGSGDSGVRGAESPARPPSGGIPTQAAADPQPRRRPAGDGQPDVSDDPRPANHVILPEHSLAPAGVIGKLNGNIKAIKLLQALEEEKRAPTDEERQTLAQYVGWGALPQVFDRLAYRRIIEVENRWGSPERARQFMRDSDVAWDKKWRKRYEEVERLLTPDEWEAARASTRNAHYTSPDVIRAMWDMVRKLGFDGGKALEPAAGIGHFIGLSPQDIPIGWTAVELDPMSARIAAQLYPRATMFKGTGFESATIGRGTQDLVISNVPFAADGPLDKRYPKMSLHNYFFARGIDVLKPGGLMVAITSDSTLDGAKASGQFREWIQDKADLVHAVRLPNNAFAENAGTEVTTDILIFRKRSGPPYAGALPITRIAEIAVKNAEGDPGKMYVNAVYVNPDGTARTFESSPGPGPIMLGVPALAGTMYRADSQALLPTPGATLQQQLDAAIEATPAGAFGAEASAAVDLATAALAPKTEEQREGGIYVVDDRLVVIEGGEQVAADWGKTRNDRARSYVALRDATMKVILAQIDQNATTDQIEAARAKLRKVYQRHTKQHGSVNDAAKHRFLMDDPLYPNVAALEVEERTAVRGKLGKLVIKVTHSPAAILERRTQYPIVEPTKAESVTDAVDLSLVWRGAIDLPWMARLTGKGETAVIDEVLALGIGLLNPETGGLELKSEYLSGDVKTKLAIAETAAAEDPAYEANVAALKEVIPEDVPISKVGVSLRSRWLEPQVLVDFAAEVFGAEITVVALPETGQWAVNARRKIPTNAGNVAKYSTAGKTAMELLEAAITMQEPTVYDPPAERGKSPTKNRDKTTAALEKVAALDEAFKAWAKTSTHAQRIADAYNEKFNRYHDAEPYVTPIKHFPGASTDIELRHHQKRAVSRGLRESHINAHEVGTGKTFTLITTAAELRRLGRAAKPMIVVQNSTIAQFTASAKRLYPSAQILSTSGRTLDKAKRQTFMSRIATGDWDMVIVPHSFYNRIADDPAQERSYIHEQITALERAKAARVAEGDDDRSPTVKQLQQAIDALNKRLRQLMNRKVDDQLTFNQMGVDALLVDEGHAYKKLQFVSEMQNVRGLDRSFSQRGLSNLLKFRHVQSHPTGRTILATGTPVTNTVAEVWNMMRYVRPDLLASHGIEHFDQFATAYTKVVTAGEQDAAGRFKTVSRLTAFQNATELAALWRLIVDYQSAEAAGLVRPDLVGGEAQIIDMEPSAPLQTVMLEILQTYQAWESLTPRERMFNSHVPLVLNTRAKQAAIDVRLVHPEMEDSPDSKLNRAVEEIYRRWAEGHPDVDNATQVVFADRFQSRKPEDDQDAGEDMDVDDTNDDGETYKPSKADQAIDDRFNVFREMRDKLIQRGVPADQIAIGNELTEKQRAAVFEAVNRGEIRVIFGTTESLGVGVNIQERLMTLHHLDAPDRPSDMEQREGRIMRQGNLISQVEILRYGVKRTFDAVAYDRLARKARFIRQIVSGQPESREFEDVSDVDVLGYDAAAALVSGNPLHKEKVEVENKLRSVNIAFNDFTDTVARARHELSYLPGELRKAIDRLAASQEREKSLAPLDQQFDDEIAVVIAGEASVGLDAATAALDAVIQDLKKEMEGFTGRKQLMDFKSEPVQIMVNGLPVYMRGIHVTRQVEGSRDHVAAGDVGVQVWSDMSTWGMGGSENLKTVAGVLNRLRRLPAAAAEDVRGRQNGLDWTRRALESAQARAAQDTFDRADELAALQKRRDEIIAALMAETNAAVNKAGEEAEGTMPSRLVKFATEDVATTNAGDAIDDVVEAQANESSGDFDRITAEDLVEAMSPFELQLHQYLIGAGREGGIGGLAREARVAMRTTADRKNRVMVIRLAFGSAGVDVDLNKAPEEWLDQVREDDILYQRYVTIGEIEKRHADKNDGAGKIPEDVARRGIDRVIDWTRSIEEAAWTRLRDKLKNRLNMGFDPTLLADIAVIGAAKFIRGARTFTVWSKEMVTQFGKDIEPYLRRLWTDANRIAAQMEGELEGKKVKAATPEQAKDRDRILKRSKGKPLFVIDKAAKAEYRRGVKEGMKRVRDQIPALRRKLKAATEAKLATGVGVREQMVRLIEDHLPKDMRGELLSSLPKADDLGDLARFLRRLNQLKGRMASGKARSQVEALREQLEAVREANRVREATANGIKRQIIRMVKENLPAKYQAKFLGDVQNARTLTDLASSVERIAHWYALSQARAQYGAIRRLTAQTKLSKLTARRRDMARHLRRRADQLRKYTLEGGGRDVSVATRPKGQRFAYPLDEYFEAVDALTDLHHRIFGILKAHRMENATIRAHKWAKKTALVAEAADNTRKSKAELLRPKGDEKRPIDRKLGLARRIALGHLNMRNLSNIVEGRGGDGRNGVLSRLWGAIQRAESRYYQRMHDHMNVLDQAVKRAGYDGLWAARAELSESMGRGMGRRFRYTTAVEGKTIELTMGEALAIAAMDPNTEALLDREGTKGIQLERGKLQEPIRFVSFDVEKVREQLAEINPKLLSMVQEIKRRVIEAHRDELFEVTHRLKGFEPDPIPHYFPRKRNIRYTEAAGAAENWRGWSEWSDQVLEEAGILKERTDTGGFGAPVVVGDFFAVILEHADVTSKIIELAERIRDYDMILSDPAMQTSIEAAWGKPTYNAMRRHLREATLVRDMSRSTGERFVRTIKANVSGAVLTLNPRTWMRQLGGIFRLTSIMPPAAFTVGLKRATKRGTYRQMIESSGYLWARYQGRSYSRYTPVAHEDVVDALDKPSIRLPAQALVENLRKGYVRPAWSKGVIGMIDAIRILDYFDSLTARIAFQGYLWLGEQRFPDDPAKALKYAGKRAEAAVRQTQNTSSPLDQTTFAITERDSLFSLVTMFTTDPLNAANRIVTAARHSKQLGAKAAAAELGNIAWSALVVGAGSNFLLDLAGISFGGGDEEDREKALQLAMEDAAWNAYRELTGLTYLRPVFGLFEGVARDQRYRADELLGNPVFDVARDIGEAGFDIAAAVEAMSEQDQEKVIAESLQALDRIVDAGARALRVPISPPMSMIRRIKRTAEKVEAGDYSD